MHAIKRPIGLGVALLAASLAVAGCARQASPGVYSGASVGETMVSTPGYVQSVRNVQIQENDRLQDNYLGAAVGGVAGGLLGSRVGGGFGKTLATGAGVVAGAAAGAAAQQELSRQSALEYVIRTDDGRYLSVVQGGPVIPVGSRVMVQQSSRGRSRVVAL